MKLKNTLQQGLALTAIRAKWTVGNLYLPINGLTSICEEDTCWPERPISHGEQWKAFCFTTSHNRIELGPNSPYDAPGTRPRCTWSKAGNAPDATYTIRSSSGTDHKGNLPVLCEN